MIPAEFDYLPPHISLSQACEAVGVSKRTLYNWMRDGKVEFVFTAGGTRRIVTASLWKAPGEMSVAPVVSGTEGAISNVR